MHTSTNHWHIITHTRASYVCYVSLQSLVYACLRLDMNTRFERTNWVRLRSSYHSRDEYRTWQNQDNTLALKQVSVISCLFGVSSVLCDCWKQICCDNFYGACVLILCVCVLCVCALIVTVLCIRKLSCTCTKSDCVIAFVSTHLCLLHRSQTVDIRSFECEKGRTIESHSQAATEGRVGTAFGRAKRCEGVAFAKVESELQTKIKELNEWDR